MSALLMRESLGGLTGRHSGSITISIAGPGKGELVDRTDLFSSGGHLNMFLQAAGLKVELSELVTKGDGLEGEILCAVGDALRKRGLANSIGVGHIKRLSSELLVVLARFDSCDSQENQWTGTDSSCEAEYAEFVNVPELVHGRTAEVQIRVNNCGVHGKHVKEAERLVRLLATSLLTPLDCDMQLALIRVNDKAGFNLQSLLMAGLGKAVRAISVQD